MTDKDSNVNYLSKAIDNLNSIIGSPNPLIQLNTTIAQFYGTRSEELNKLLSEKLDPFYFRKTSQNSTMNEGWYARLFKINLWISNFRLIYFYPREEITFLYSGESLLNHAPQFFTYNNRSGSVATSLETWEITNSNLPVIPLNVMRESHLCDYLLSGNYKPTDEPTHQPD